MGLPEFVNGLGNVLFTSSLAFIVPGSVFSIQPGFPHSPGRTEALVRGRIDLFSCWNSRRLSGKAGGGQAEQFPPGMGPLVLRIWIKVPVGVPAEMPSR